MTHVEEKEEEEAHSVAVAEHIVKVVREEAVALERRGVFNVKHFDDLLSGFSIQVIVYPIPILNSESLEMIESHPEPCRVRIMLSLLQLIDMKH